MIPHDMLALEIMKLSKLVQTDNVLTPPAPDVGGVDECAAMAVSLCAPLFHGPALPSSTGPTYLSGPEGSPRATARGTLGDSMTASANASSIADGEITTRAVRLPRLGLWYPVRPRGPF